MEIASEVNKSCPIAIDKDTRLDNMIALPSKTLQYNYTLVNYEKIQLDSTTLDSLLRPGIINSVKSAPNMEILRKNDVIFLYSYYDNVGEHVLSITISPELYK
jgi:hypothetical protein